ncbi:MULTISPECIES: acetyl-CoA carboxylase carboxyltransferase subunit alpha [Clostridium]|jgi:acetyl-CoA carboxylase carboxyl transferase subunit alpha|uniref:Acetyl-coenzyme A carboxylase carboxyl transferase subunit alpha n=1 Tax=Clostridium saccharoperbutylacetonicum N1-4(HMT) TaxID=931276 RepID=M1MTR8_9CLOT|nr:MULTISPECIES: acetyl-CoA carboxylase carboxyltransferase subunit alpha [Clostridium]AGF54947.1 acetyl-coenzyme A carboxylase carboxyl transferase subunit alpha [Clostridium saccharoperbutylacetonicum N1-4(HMT)]NRT64348.1 acetyl-CoA carboxylase carboxyl transferase subunit alpha [Clostridium saccharoperbutylacetonicum]NSB27717.1 acetyl-CoA carboxylase carboxyl transferase subunit alpha [Clostridium saccharoperbutylacetonicum]NSB41204.1 acetyl-CoA carboxylase carboxyl transferase subunit alpha
MDKDFIKINTTPWENVEIARHKDRPTGKYYIETIFNDFIEFHGDRSFGDDKSIIGGIASIGDTNVTVIAITKGSNTNENIERNFGMPNPEGYRKALRLMKQAEKFKRPVVCFIDTPGAFPGIGAEERGQGQAIANNLFELSRLKTPIISILTGEGGSGGALALAVADKIFMLEYSIYSILTPEGFASILWKDASRAKEAASVMKITAKDLKDFNIIDDIIKEPRGGAHRNPGRTAGLIKKVILDSLQELKDKNLNELVQDRYNKFRQMGNFY